MMVELLAGALISDVFGFEEYARNPDDSVGGLGGHFMIAIDPVRCVSHDDRGAQLAHAEKLFTRILQEEGTRLPSQRRYTARTRTPTEGVTIPKSLHDTLLGYARS